MKVRGREKAAEVLARGGTQARAAEAAGVTVRTIQHWIADRAFSAMVEGLASMEPVEPAPKPRRWQMGAATEIDQADLCDFIERMTLPCECGSMTQAQVWTYYDCDRARRGLAPLSEGLKDRLFDGLPYHVARFYDSGPLCLLNRIGWDGGGTSHQVDRDRLAELRVLAGFGVEEAAA